MREMKDSGVEWIGQIPKEWTIKKVKHLFTKKNEKAQQDSPIILSLARSGVRERDISNNEGQLAESYFNYNPVDLGDLLLNPMDLYSGANCSVSKIKGVISPAYVNLKAKQSVNPFFYDYYFKVQYWLMAFFSYGKGVSFDNRWTLNNETLMNYPVLSFDYNEQCRIADYLDSKCSKIDAIIEREKAVIEKLKEYKMSVITEAVTKGLNPDVAMKDSGVEWIGKIPEGWSTTLLSTLFKQRKNKNTGMIENNLLSLSYGNIKKKNINSNEGLLPESFESYNIIEIGDIVFRLTDLQNDKKSLRTGLCKQKGIITSAYVTLTLVKQDSPAYMHYLFHMYDICKVFYGMGDGVRQGMGYDDLKKLRVLLPSYTQQQAIADYLDNKCTQIESTIAKKQAVIDKLTEYKKSLIYEVVTGKKEV